MDRTPLDNALSSLTRHFAGLFQDVWDTPIPTAHPGCDVEFTSDLYFAVSRLTELVADIYAADIAVSHTDPRNGAGLRAVAAKAMSYASFLREDIERIEGRADDPAKGGAS